MDPKDKEALRLDHKKEFILALAKFLAEDQGGKSIYLQMEQGRSKGDPRPTFGLHWADLRDKAGLHSWVSVEEATAKLTERLG